MEELKLREKDEFINLSQLLKAMNLVESGAMAKEVIENGEVKYFLMNEKILVNNIQDNRRGRKLYKNDLINIQSIIYKIC